MLLFKSIFALVILIAFTLANNIDFYDIIEPCEGLFVTKDHEPDLETAVGVNENTTLYFPFLSKLDAVELTKNLYESRQFEKLTESQLANSCITIRKSSDGKTLTMYGYNGKTFKKHLTEIAPKVVHFPRTFPHGLGAKISIALTDSKSYTLFDVCYEDGTRSFGVISGTPFLDDETLNIIKAHLKSIGFKEKNFLSFNYDSCVEVNDGIFAPNVGIEELPKPIKPRPGWVVPQVIGLQPAYDYLVYPSYLYYKKKDLIVDAIQYTLKNISALGDIMI